MVTAGNPDSSDLLSRNRRLVEALALACSPDALAEGAVLRDQAQERSFAGRQAITQFLQTFFAEGCAPAKTRIQTVIAAEDAAVLTLVYHGRPAGHRLGLPPTQTEVELPMAFVCQIEAGYITRADLYYNAGTLLRQWGLGL